MRWLIACLCLGFAVAAAAEPAPAGPPEVELDGWRLQQFASAVQAELGPPFKEVDQDEIHYKVYMVGKKAYLVVGTRQPLVNNIDSLQLTGESAEAVTFRGLRLGDGADKVRSLLGTPAAITPVGEPDVLRWEYPERNYSIEVDRHDRLYSVRLHTDARVLKPEEGSSDFWPAFKQAIDSRAFDRIEPWLRPDVEIYRNGTTLAIGQRYSRFRQGEGEALREALVGDRMSVRSAVAAHEPEGLVRVTENMGVGMVFKFPEGSALEELVFFPYAGRWCLFEASFREGAERMPGASTRDGAPVAAQ